MASLREKLKALAQDKFKLTVLIIGILLFCVVAFVGGIQITMSPEFCKLCHKAMMPEYVTWKVSSHSRIRCVDCHAAFEEGMIAVYIEKIGAVKHLVEYTLGTYHTPIKMKHSIPSERCMMCHSDNRNYTVSGDLIVPHKKHEEKGVACIECHRGVAHGNIYSRGVISNKAELAKWTLEDGKKNMIKDYTSPDMDTCINCHKNRGVTFRCEACHSTIFTPDDHKDWNTWKTKHGKDAEANINSCNKCHSYGMKVDVNINTGNKTFDYAWGNEFCRKCHSQKPDDHKNRDVWMPYHKEAVKAKGMTNCQACHSIKEDMAAKSPASRVYCNTCHWFK